MTEFQWEEYTDVLCMLILGIHEEFITNAPPEKLLDRINNEITKKSSNGTLPSPVSQFNKRDILIPHTYKKQIGTASRGLYTEYVKAINEYYAGNYSKTLSIAENIHTKVVQLSIPEERLFITILLSDIYLMIANSFVASPLCLECANSCELPISSPIRGAALSMLGDIAFRKRLYSLALQRYHEAMEIWNHNSQYDCLSITQSDRSRTLFFMDNYTEALSEIAAATKTAKKLKNSDPLAYCLLTEIELASLMRDTELAKTKLEEYSNSNASNSNLRNSHWEMMILARYHVERSDFKECLKELLFAGVFLKQLDRHEHMPDVMVMLASYLNYEGAYEDALLCLLECYDLYPELTSYRFALFIQWLHAMEIALRGNDKSKLANAASALSVRFLNHNIMELRNTLLGRTGWWQNLRLRDEFIDELRGLKPRYFSKYGLRIDLNSGDIYLESSLEPEHTLSDDQIKVFRQFALNLGVAFKNREIIRSYDPRIAELEEPPRRDNYYIPLFRKLFLRLCGNQIIENRRGSGYYIPKL